LADIASDEEMPTPTLAPRSALREAEAEGEAAGAEAARMDIGAGAREREGEVGFQLLAQTGTGDVVEVQEEGDGEDAKEEEDAKMDEG
jgi:hypothetical protein